MSEIETVGLSTRALNCLRRAGYTTLAAVRATTDQDLLDIRNMGVRSLVEVREKIGGGSVLDEVQRERWAQDAKHGDQSHLPDGTGPELILSDLPQHGTIAWADNLAAWAKARCKAASQNEGGDGSIAFEHILTEEWAEAIAEDDPARLRAELIQVAAVAVQWVEAIDRRTGGRPHPGSRAGVVTNHGRLEAWISTPLPGGWVCAEPDPAGPDGLCGMPVEDAPCTIHHPGEAD